MLLLSSDSFTVDGVTVFPDHADPNQFWCLPAPVGLATLPGSDEPQFNLIEYTPDVATSGVNGVGFLNVTLCLELSQEAQNKILGRIKSAFSTADDPRVAPVPFDDGTVQIVTLDMQGSGGAVNTAPPGSIQMVEHILGAVTPDLYGNNNAVFALTLSEAGATILEDAFQNGLAPVGGIYNLKFTGVRPALDVKVTADLKRVYDSFSVALTAKAYFVQAGIDATFEKLRQDGAIKIQVVNLAGDAANADKEKEALALFKDDILTSWFTPSLSPTTAAAADAGSHGLPLGSTGATTTTTTTSGPAGGAGHAASPPPPPPPAPQSVGMTGGSAQGAGMQGGGMQSTQPAQAAKSSAPTTSGPATPASASAGPNATKTTTTQPAGASTVGQVAQAAQAVAGAASSAASAASPFGVSLQLKFVHQDEQKVVTYEYNRMDAVQRTYAPQGYFGLLLKDIDQSKHFLKVDGTDPFFSKFSVVLTPTHDFASIGLQVVHVALDYGDRGTAGAKHGEYVFDATSAGQVTWDVFEGQVHRTDFSYTATYTFDPDLGWEGATNTYTLPATTTENRQLTLDPHDVIGFMIISIAPGRIDATTVDRVEVALTYADNKGWNTSGQFVVRAGQAPQTWKLRLSDKSQRTFSYSTRCILKDGTVFAADAQTSVASALFVNDAFGGGVDVAILPAFDAAHVKSAVVELDYTDEAAHYRYSTTEFLQPASDGSPQPTRVHIPLVDATKRQFTYTITLIGADGQKLSGPPITSDDPNIVIANSL
jgi:hypothetical protein